MLQFQKQIRNILTLRYDPEEAPAIPPLAWTDFEPTNSDPEGFETENRLLNNLDFLSNYDKLVIALSSGVDSPLVLAMLRKKFPDKKITAIHYSATNNNELTETKNIAERFNADLVIVKLDSVYQNIKKMVKILNAPKWDAYDFIIAENARKYGDILITGDGADELFGGYVFRYGQLLESGSIAQLGHPETAIQSYLHCHHNDWVENQKDVFGMEFDMMRDIIPYFVNSFDNPLSILDKCFLADYNGKLIHNFLVKKNAFLKEFKIPIFSPFLTDDVISWATHLPHQEKYKDGVGKLTLRNICKRYDLNPTKEKLGFTHDIISEWETLQGNYSNLLLDEQSLIYKYGLVNFDWVKANFHIQKSDKEPQRIINKLVSIYATEIYLRWQKNPE